MNGAPRPLTPRFLVSGPFRLDTVDESLWRHGQLTPLGSKAFALLRAFMQAPQTLLTKDQLIDRVWGDRAVSESVLTTAIKDLRRALGDDARNPTIIRTVHGQGYRFMLPVEAADNPAASVLARVSSEADARSPSRRRILAAGLAAVGVTAAVGAGLVVANRRPATEPAEKSLAVLPFKDLSEGRDQAWFADGLTEEVLNSLARTPDLRVVSREASAQFRGSDSGLREIARRLSVAHLLEGTVRRVGDRLRVAVALIRAADESHIWSKVYDERGEDVISVQENIAFDIARALKTVMEPAKLRAMVEAGTRSVDAYEAYLQGLALEQQNLSQGDVRYARAAADAFEQARTLDPGFAVAHWRAAQSWYGNTTRIDSSARGNLSDSERRRQYLERLGRAIATSKDDVERLKYTSAAAVIQLRLRAAHRLLAKYLEARPRDLDAWDEMSDIGGYVGERAWVARAAEQIHTQSMRDGAPLSRAITASVYAQETEGAVRRANEQLALRPGEATTQYQAHRAYLNAGKVAEARAILERISASGMNPWSRHLAALRQACAEGRVDDARALRVRIEGSGQLSPRWHAAQTMGDSAGAEALLRPYDRPEGLATLVQFMVYPSFDPRPYPSLMALLAREGITRPPATPLPYACKAR